MLGEVAHVMRFRGDGYVWPSDLYTGYEDVTVTVTDGRGGEATASVPVSVVNAAPRVAVSEYQSVAFGESVHLSTTFSDAGTGDTHTAAVDWGGGGGGEPDFDRVEMVEHAAVFGDVVFLTAEGELVFAHFTIERVAAVTLVHHDAIVGIDR